MVLHSLNLRITSREDNSFSTDIKNIFKDVSLKLCLKKSPPSRRIFERSHLTAKPRMIRTVYPETLYAPRILDHVCHTLLELFLCDLPICVLKGSELHFHFTLAPPNSSASACRLTAWQVWKAKAETRHIWIQFCFVTVLSWTNAISSQLEFFHLQNRIIKPSRWDCSRDQVNSSSICTWPWSWQYLSQYK